MRSAHASQPERFGPGANRSQIARRSVTSAARLIAFSFMTQRSRDPRCEMTSGVITLRK